LPVYPLKYSKRCNTRMERRRIYFIDRALAAFDQDQRDICRTGLGLTEVASAIEQTGVAAGTPPVPSPPSSTPEFFEALRRHVVIGFLASAAWGGNRDKVGWKLPVCRGVHFPMGGTSKDHIRRAGCAMPKL
jgi:hypothetical protein